MWKELKETLALFMQELGMEHELMDRFRSCIAEDHGVPESSVLDNDAYMELLGGILALPMGPRTEWR
eukprot:42885-Alexandrium_andersonii.AAC.1